MYLFISILCLLWLPQTILLAEVPLTDVSSRELIQVALTTESRLHPIAIVWQPISGLPESYKKLESVLNFDLNHSGYLQTLSVSQEKISGAKAQESTQKWSTWRQWGAYYVVEIQLSGESLQAFVFDVRAKRSSASTSYTLTGIFEKDRRQVHKLNDWIIQAITGHPGIAGSRLIYTVEVTPGGQSRRPRTQVCQSDYDGANVRILLEQDALLVTPCYLPHTGHNPSHFAVVSYKLGQPKILFSSMDGKFRRVTALGGSQLAPAVDPQGQQMAFICDVEGNPDIYWTSLHLKEQRCEKIRRLFGSKRGTQASPSFSPDGKRLAFVSSKDGVPRIYTIEIADYLQGKDSDQAKLISRKNHLENTCPAWSPNGRYIAYSARNTGARQIWIYDTQTQTETCVTEGDNIKENPSWANDSLHFFYNQEDPSGCHIYMSDINQKQPVRITRHRGATRFPSCSK